MTEQQVPCPRCSQEHRPVPAGRAWASKVGPLSKALAVGVAALATEAGLSWLRHRIGAEAQKAHLSLPGSS
jgi:hypothetical protein